MQTLGGKMQNGQTDVAVARQKMKIKKKERRKRRRGGGGREKKIPMVYTHHHHHQSLNREGRWGITDDFATSFLHFFPVLHCPLGLAELQACPFPDVVFPPLPLFALSSSPFHCALKDGFGQTWWTGNMTIPLQFASFYDRQEIFMWSNCLLDLGTDLLVGNMVFVWDV